MRTLAAVLLALVLVACAPATTAGDAGTGDADGGTSSADAGPAPVDGGYPPPSTTATPAVGSAHSLDIAAWNIHNFPSTPASPELIADLVASLDLDVVAFEEVDSE